MNNQNSKDNDPFKKYIITSVLLHIIFLFLLLRFSGLYQIQQKMIEEDMRFTLLQEEQALEKKIEKKKKKEKPEEKIEEIIKPKKDKIKIEDQPEKQEKKVEFTKKKEEADETQREARTSELQVNKSAQSSEELQRNINAFKKELNSIEEEKLELNRTQSAPQSAAKDMKISLDDNARFFSREQQTKWKESVKKETVVEREKFNISNVAPELSKNKSDDAAAEREKQNLEIKKQTSISEDAMKTSKISSLNKQVETSEMSIEERTDKLKEQLAQLESMLGKASSSQPLSEKKMFASEQESSKKVIESKSISSSKTETAQKIEIQKNVKLQETIQRAAEQTSAAKTAYNYSNFQKSNMSNSAVQPERNIVSSLRGNAAPAGRETSSSSNIKNADKRIFEASVEKSSKSGLKQSISSKSSSDATQTEQLKIKENTISNLNQGRINPATGQISRTIENKKYQLQKGFKTGSDTQYYRAMVTTAGNKKYLAGSAAASEKNTEVNYSAADYSTKNITLKNSNSAFDISTEKSKRILASGKSSSINYKESSIQTQASSRGIGGTGKITASGNVSLKTGSAALENISKTSQKLNDGIGMSSGGKGIIDEYAQAGQEIKLKTKTNNYSEKSSGRALAKSFDSSNNSQTTLKIPENFDEKIDYSKFGIKNATNKYNAKKIDTSQSNSEGRTNVSVNLAYNQYEMNPEYINIRKKKSEDVIKYRFNQRFPIYKDKLIASANKENFSGEIEMTYEKNGKLKKYKFIKSDITAEKNTKKIFEEYIASMNLALPIDFEVFIVVKITFDKNGKTPVISVEFY